MLVQALVVLLQAALPEVATTPPELTAGGATTSGAAAVSPEVVCAVQHAVRWREAPWTPRECARVAAALDATPTPRLLAAVVSNESDWRPRAVLRVRPGVYDVGLAGVRCVLPGAGAGESRDPTASTLTTSLQHPRGRCTNGPARGLTVRQLQDPATNIRVAAQVLAEKGGDLGSYNGATTRGKRERYSRKVAALVAALGGVKVPVKGRRLRGMVRKITAAVAGVEES
jgi:hypothetical protein